jgi:hypothetical protein
MKLSSLPDESTYLSDKPKGPNNQVYNSNQQQQEDRETETAENSQYKEQKVKYELTSQ